MSFGEKVKARIQDVRQRRPFIDHVMRMVEHYGAVYGTTLAGGITYFGFLSVFPLLLLAFAIIGWVSGAFPDARDYLMDVIDQVLPGMVGGEGGLDMSVIESAAPGIASIGLITVLYSGSGWIEGMRRALTAVFEVDEGERPGFLKARATSVAALGLLGTILLLSVAVSGVLTRLVRPILEGLQVGPGVGPALTVVAVTVGLAANTVLFWCIFRILGQPDIPSRSLWSGAFVGAVGFEALKQLSTLLLSSTSNQPAFQAFGIALVLVVWINYFARLLIYSACWAWTAPAARAYREGQLRLEGRVEGPQLHLPAAAEAVRNLRPGEYVPGRRARDEQLRPEALFAVGAGAMLAVVTLLRRTVRR